MLGSEMVQMLLMLLVVLLEADRLEKIRLSWMLLLLVV